MAQVESDKEDLMAEASALVERAEYQLSATDADDSETVDEASRTSVPLIVTVGFRRNNHFSIYFDQDPFYQFDADGLLRRALEGGFLYRSQGSTLAKLHRLRTESTTVLQRADLPAQQLEEFRQRMGNRLSRFQIQLQSGDLHRLRCESQRGDLEDRTATALTSILKHDDHFLSTAIRKRR